MTNTDAFVVLIQAVDNHDRDYGAEGNVDEVISKQDGRQKALWLIEHVGDPPGAGHTFAEQVRYPRPLKGQEGRLRARKEGGQHQEA